MFSTHTFVFFKTDSDQRAGVSYAGCDLDLSGLMADTCTRRADLYALKQAHYYMSGSSADFACEVYIGDMSGGKALCGQVTRDQHTGNLVREYYG